MLRRLPVRNRNTEVRREHDGATLRHLLRYALAGFVLAGGFTLAAWQHFQATRYGYEQEKLRREKLQLEAEKNSLQAKREEKLALPNVERRARAAGLLPAQPQQIKSLPEKSRVPTTSRSPSAR